MSENFLSVLFCFVLIIIALIDLRKFIIPNLLIFVLLIITGLKLVLFENVFIYNLFSGFIVLGLLLVLYFFGKKILGKEALGFGDIKLLTVIAFYHGVIFTLAGIWMASLLGIIGYLILKSAGKQFSRHNKIPFGFFIGLTFVIFTIYEYDLKVFLLGNFV